MRHRPVVFLVAIAAAALITAGLLTAYGPRCDLPTSHFLPSPTRTVERIVPIDEIDRQLLAMEEREGMEAGEARKRPPKPKPKPDPNVPPKPPESPTKYPKAEAPIRDPGIRITDGGEIDWLTPKGTRNDWRVKPPPVQPLP